MASSVNPAGTARVEESVQAASPASTAAAAPASAAATKAAKVTNRTPGNIGICGAVRYYKVAIAIGHGKQSGIIHTGQIFPIDAKQEDIIKEQSGVLSFSPIGMGETLFEDRDEDMKQFVVNFKISNAEEFNDGDVCKFSYSPFSMSLGN